MTRMGRTPRSAGELVQLRVRPIRVIRAIRGSDLGCGSAAL